MEKFELISKIIIAVNRCFDIVEAFIKIAEDKNSKNQNSNANSFNKDKK